MEAEETRLFLFSLAFCFRNERIVMEMKDSYNREFLFELRSKARAKKRAEFTVLKVKRRQEA